MGKDHTNIDTNQPYEMPGGKCEADYSGEDRRKILEGNVPELDMGIAPNARTNNGKKEKSY